MPEQKYRVVFKGDIIEGNEIDQVKQNLSSLLKADPEKIDALFSGQLKIIKKDATQEKCMELQNAFERAGAICHIELEKNNERAEEDVKKDSPSPGPPPLPPPLPKPRQAFDSGSRPSYPTRGPDEKFCESCGAILKINMLACPHCGKKAIKSDSMPGCAIAAIVLGVFFVLVMVIGILAAIAIPNFIAYRNKAYQSAVRSELIVLSSAEEEYYKTNGTYTASLEALKYTATNPMVSIVIMRADQECYHASGTMAEMRNELWVDCYGNEEMVEKGTVPDEDNPNEDAFETEDATIE